MKIVSWNCSGALRRKLKEIDRLGADILVIQECEDPSRSTNELQEWAGNYLWVGATKHKGIGVFPKKKNNVERLNWNGEFSIAGLSSKSPAISWKTSNLRLFLPFRINRKVNVLGVWTKGTDSEIFGYMGQFWKFLQIHKLQLSQESTIILGDFNSNKIWDKLDRWWNHSDVVAELADIEITSLYHVQRGEDHGKETTPTFFHYRREDRPYHIDYAFLSRDLLKKSVVDIGARDEWIHLSDHMPVTVEISV